MIAIVVLTLFAGAMGQRSPYLGRPKEYPGVLPRFGGGSSGGDLGDRLGEQPVQQNVFAQGTLHDQQTIDKVAQWPEDKQPYWFKNREHIAAHRGVRGTPGPSSGTSIVGGNRRSGSTDVSEETGSGSGNVGGNRRSGSSGVNEESGSGSGNVSGNRRFESSSTDSNRGSGSSNADSNRRSGSSNADSNKRSGSSNTDSNRRSGSNTE